MRTLSKLLLAGLGTLVATGAALAAADRVHVMDVALPDGSVAHVRYVGDIAPKVVVAPAMPVAFAAADPFATMDRISAEMDRQMDAMMQHAAMLAAPATGSQLSDAALRRLPPGTVSYTYTSYSSGDGASCSQSVQVTSLGADQAPKVVRQSSDGCTTMNSRTATPAVQQQAKPDQPALTPASLDKAKLPKASRPVI
jgi:hypothetical protein